MLETAQSVFEQNGKANVIKLIPKLSSEITREDLENKVRLISIFVYKLYTAVSFNFLIVLELTKPTTTFSRLFKSMDQN